MLQFQVFLTKLADTKFHDRGNTVFKQSSLRFKKVYVPSLLALRKSYGAKALATKSSPIRFASKLTFFHSAKL